MRDRERIVEGILGCPRCGDSPLVLWDHGERCESCGWTANRVGHVLTESERTSASFDAKFSFLDTHNHHPVVWDLCYRDQCEEIVAALDDAGSRACDDASIVLDIGCGPDLPYQTPGKNTVVVGVDPSLASLAANERLDLGLHSSAERIGLVSSTVDVIIAVYALHHMIGDSIAESWSNVEAAMTEMARIAASQATVIVLEICPRRSAWLAERMSWRMARTVLGDRIDFVFWPAASLIALGRRLFPSAKFGIQRFTVPPFSRFPPIIGYPRFKVPRVLYPFDVCLLRWDLPGD